MISLSAYSRVVIFTGAGMSAESGVPTYRGRGGIWNQYRYEDYACERAFRRNADAVLDFHEVRRERVLACAPHDGHFHLAKLQERHPDLAIVTQNIDRMHQRAGARVAAELHGSLWRRRCPTHGISEDAESGQFRTPQCQRCGATLRPDSGRSEDAGDHGVFAAAERLIAQCDLFVSIGTSAIVMPAASLIPFDRRPRPRLVEINPEETEASAGFEESWRERASRLGDLVGA